MTEAQRTKLMNDFFVMLEAMIQREGVTYVH
jgi:hypothetical protein